MAPRTPGRIDRARLPARSIRLLPVTSVSIDLGAPAGSYASFREWLIAHWQGVEELALTRTTQTNEAGRAAALLPVLGLLPGPLSLIEVGASAGLCLYPDRYSYLYGGHRSVHPTGGPSPVLLHCKTTGEPPIPDEVP
ncbi:MAG: DUF2332 family protein, partial [Actinomycetales bacterium]